MNQKTRSLSFAVGLLTLIAVSFNNCGGFKSVEAIDSSQLAQGGGLTTPSPSPNPSPSPSPGPLPQNSFSVEVGAFTSQGSPNTLMTSATICIPGTTNCTVISNLQMDTGSQGLRVFASALPTGFVNGLQLSGIGECMFFGGANVMWGPIAPVTVQLGGEVSAAVPMQLVQQSFGDNGTKCMNYATEVLANAGLGTGNPPYFDSPTSYNGIIGVNYIPQDCGSFCVGSSNSNNGIYYSCSGSTCNSTAVALNQQVANPVAFMPVDNNGVTLQLPAVSAFKVSITGTAYLGVGTQSNNTPSGSPKIFTADTNINDACYSWYKTTWNGSTGCGFMDSGSAALFITNSTSNPMSTDQYGDFDPSSPTTISATMIGMNGVSAAENFVIASPDSATASDEVIPNWGVVVQSGPFDWGLPFFFGKTVYVGIQGATTPLGAGPFYAF